MQNNLETYTNNYINNLIQYSVGAICKAMRKNG